MSGKQRLSFEDVDPTAYKAVQGLEDCVRTGGIEPRLLELVRVRASQINGCAFCLDMHNADARTHGEDQRRLDILPAWREAPGMFSLSEQAALALTEALTSNAKEGVSDRLWDDLARHFHERQIVRLVLAVATINVWNRLAVSFRTQLPDRA